MALNSFDPVPASPVNDIDLHLVVSKASSLESADWRSIFPTREFCFSVFRPASGSVRKVTVVLSTGQLDLVIVPSVLMRMAELGLKFRLHRRFVSLRNALDEMATCLRSGYRFIKGGRRWQDFYRKVSRLPGVRIDNVLARRLADASVCDILWIRQKLEAGELIAAQHVLHSRVSDTNLRLWRELRLRQGLPLPSFGLGRGLEVLACPTELPLFSLSAQLRREELHIAVSQALENLNALMASLDSNWYIPQSMRVHFQRQRF
jgi:hypothetical protein